MQTPAQIAKCRGLLSDIPASVIQTTSIDFSALPVDVATPSCGCPDMFDEEIANHEDTQELADNLGLSITACQGLIEAHARMYAAATGSGSYPPGCNKDYPNIHAVAYYDDPDIWPNHLKRPLTDKEFQSIIDAKVWGPSGDPNGTPFTMAELKAVWGGKPMNEVVNDFVEETYRIYGVILYPVTTGPNGQHNIHVSYPVIYGSTIGIGWFPGSNPCPGDHVNLHIDRTYEEGFQEQVGLKGHEVGHCLLLMHQFVNQNSHQEPLSYSYRNHLYVGFSNGDPVYKLPKAPSVAVLTKLYGGKPEGVPWKGKFANNPTPITSWPFKIAANLSTDNGGPIRGDVNITLDGKTYPAYVSKKPDTTPAVYEIVPKPFQ